MVELNKLRLLALSPGICSAFNRTNCVTPKLLNCAVVSAATCEVFKALS